MDQEWVKASEMTDTSEGMDEALRALKIDPARRQRGRRRTAWLRAVMIGAVLLGVAGYFVSRGRLNPVEVEVAATQRLDPGAPTPLLTAGGYIIPHRKVELAPKITGRVEWIGVEKGDAVKRGQVLLRIERSEFLAAAERAAASLDGARARLRELEAGSRPEEIERSKAAVEESRSNAANAALELERFERLHAEGAVARQALDAARNRREVALAQLAGVQQSYQLARLGPRQEQLDAARAAVREAEAARRAAQVDLDNTQISAPISGIILERLVEPGEIVTISFIGGRGAKSAVLSLADLQVLDVEVDVSQNEIGKVRLGQPTSIVADAFPERTYRGSVSEMAPEANRQKATLQVKVRVAEADGVIRPEMNAKVTFLEPPTGTGGPPKVFAPKEAVFTREGQSLVYTLDGEKATARPVRLGGEADGRVEVREGLRGGELVIVRGVELLKDGQRVRVKK
jgi:HlyD family secretion protein